MLDFKTVLLPKGLRAYSKNLPHREEECLYLIFTGKSEHCKSEQCFFWRELYIFKKICIEFFFADYAIDFFFF